MWKAEDKSIINFDPDIIDQYLADIEKSYKESQIDQTENITESDNA